MATQDDLQGIPVWYERQQESLRLLELPPELLDSVTRGSSPSIFLKSADPAPNKPPAHVVLCTNNQTYQLRQVQTSNSIFVVRPESRTSHELELPNSGLSLFATCASTLEITPLSKADATKLSAPAQWLRDTTAPYNGAEQYATDLTKANIFESIPFSDGELEEAWFELCGFCTSDNKAFLPTPSVLVEAWNTLLMNASILAMDPADPIMLTDNLVELLDSTGIPRQLFEAILKRTSQSTPDQDVQQYTLDKELTIAFTGKALLDEGDYEGQPWRFVSVWKDMVPELWRESITTGSYTALKAAANDKQIRVEELTAYLSGKAAAPDLDTAPAKRAGGPSRDWHERFKRNRK